MKGSITARIRQETYQDILEIDERINILKDEDVELVVDKSKNMQNK